MIDSKSNDIANLTSMVNSLLMHIKISNPSQTRKITPILSSLDFIGSTNKYIQISKSITELTDEIRSSEKEQDKKSAEKCQKLLEYFDSISGSFSPDSEKLSRLKILLSQSNKSVPDILDCIQAVASEMAFSIETYKELAFSSKKIIDKQDGFKSGTDRIMHSDVALATKRISRDLVKLGAQLAKSKPDCEESKAIISEINEVVSSSDISFFRCIDILSRITWKIQGESERELVKSKNSLIDLATKFSSVASVFSEASTAHSDSKSNADRFNRKFQEHLAKLNSIGLNSTSLEQIKKEMLNHVNQMQDDLVRHISGQNKIMEKQDKIIFDQNTQICAIKNHAESIRDQLNQTIESSSIDSLTGINNRSTFNVDIENKHKEWSSKKSTHLSVSIIDLDNFKNINDTHGHLIGDEVLKHVARVIHSRCSNYEEAKCYRYGGEEFALIIEAKSPLDIIRACKDVHQSIGKTIFTSSSGLIQMNVTCSMGVDYFSVDSSISKAIDHADKAMYKAKNSGKNRVWLASRKAIDEHLAAVKSK